VLHREGDIDGAGERQGFAIVQRLELGELLGVLLNEVGELPDEARPLGREHAAPRAGLERRAGGLDGFVDVGRAPLGDLGDGLSHGGVEGGEGPAGGGLEPLAADEHSARLRQELTHGLSNGIGVRCGHD
jgi:hypothetical protein